MDNLNDAIYKLNHELKDVLNQRSLIESKKLQLDNNLQNNLKKRQEELISELDRQKLRQRSTKTDLYKTELDLINERIDLIEKKQVELSNSINQLLKTDITKLEKELEKIQDLERKIQDELQESTVGKIFF